MVKLVTAENASTKKFGVQIEMLRNWLRPRHFGYVTLFDLFLRKYVKSMYCGDQPANSPKL